MRNFLIAGFVILLIQFLQGQEPVSPNRRYHSVEIGYPVYATSGFYYRPATILYFQNYPLTKAGKGSSFSMYFEPQLAPVVFRNTFYMEFGINGGINYSVKLSENSWAYFQAGTGPYLLSVRTKRQAIGFIFSDNLAIGFRRLLPKSKDAINLQFRWRHVSNAGLKEPNIGLNNAFILLGLSRFLN